MTVQIPLVARRSFVARLGIGLAAFGAALAQGSAAGAQTAPPLPLPPWKATRHPQDDWLDRVPGQHRLVFDTTMPDGLGGAMFYASNFFTANQNGTVSPTPMRPSSSSCGTIRRRLCTTTRCGRKDGTVLAERSHIIDPKTGQPPKININNAATPQNLGTTLDSLIAKGAHFAVCEMATRRISGAIAQATGGNAATIYGELVANLIGNAHMAAAGILAVNRAQERGYAFANVGV